jgi:hypothetical protein
MIEKTKEMLVKRFLTRLNKKISLTEDEIICFLEISLSAFNSIPVITYYSFSDYEFCETFSAVIINYAMYLALSKAAVSETSSMPKISDLLEKQSEREYEIWDVCVSEIKSSDSFTDWIPSD